MTIEIHKDGTASLFRGKGLPIIMDRWYRLWVWATSRYGLNAITHIVDHRA